MGAIRAGDAEHGPSDLRAVAGAGLEAPEMPEELCPEHELRRVQARRGLEPSRPRGEPLPARLGDCGQDLLVGVTVGGLTVNGMSTRAAIGRRAAVRTAGSSFAQRRL